LTGLRFLRSAPIGRAMGTQLSGKAIWVRMAAVLLVAITLAPRFLIPAGYMPGNSNSLTLMLCSGASAVTIDLGKSHKQDNLPGDQAPCAFSAATAPLLSSAPPIELAAAILYIERHGVDADPAEPVTAPLRLRPPLRGPPSV